jgi:hypothetical protein
LREGAEEGKKDGFDSGGMRLCAVLAVLYREVRVDFDRARFGD